MSSSAIFTCCFADTLLTTIHIVRSFAPQQTLVQALPIAGNIWYPFFKIADNQALEEEQALAAAKVDAEA